MHTPETRARAAEKVKQRRLAWFSDKKCVQCNVTTDLELDHIDPTTKISHKIWSWSEERRTAELAKCQALCHGCHEKKTAEENRIRNGGLHHGTETMYGRYGCRCEACRQARSITKAANRARRKLLGLPYQ